MTRYQIARLLHTGGGRYAAKPITVDLHGFGPSTDRFYLGGGGIPDAQVRELTAARPDPDDPRVRALHTLAVSVHTDREFRSALGREFAWPGYQYLELDPHARELPQLTPGQDHFAFFSPTPSSGVIRFDYSRSGTYACLSADICAHEVVHALLHAAKGWTSADDETRAVTECVGDVFSMLLAADHRELRRAALAEAPDLSESNLLSRFGDLPGGVSLRDATRFVSWEEGRQRGPYGMAEAVAWALYEALRGTFAALAREAEAEAALAEAALRLARAVLGGIDSLTSERVRVEALAHEVSRRADEPLAGELDRAWTAIGIDASPALEAVAVASLEPIAGDLDDLPRLLERELGGAVRLHRVVTRPRLRRARFPLETQRTVELSWRIHGAERPACLTVDAQGHAAALCVG